VLVAAVHQGWVTAIVIVVTIITTIVATQHAQLDVAMMLLPCDQTSVVLVCWLASMPAGSVGATACAPLDVVASVTRLTRIWHCMGKRAHLTHLQIHMFVDLQHGKCNM
jgi:hypothetical protein